MSTAAMLEIYHSNRLEILADALALVTERPLRDPFQPEQIVVQNPGMARWIAQQLAQRSDIGACQAFPLPASFFWQVLQAWLPQAPDSALFDRDALMWRVFALLPELCEQAAFTRLQHYLGAGRADAGHDDRRLFQLVQRIADLFDQYLVFRPDLVLAWEQGEGEDWQAILWRRLCEHGDHAHRAGLLAELEQVMQAGGEPTGVLPERVSVFGLTALAPVYLRLLGALARFVPVHVFYLNPCEEYWADLVDERGQALRRARALRAGDPDPTGLLDIGNPLLASLGHAGQVFLDQLLELGGRDHDLFEPPTGDSLLHRVQRDVLSLSDPRDADARPAVATNDSSIQVHGVHSPLREVQVLHDRLLRQFERLDGLEPRDVIVMAPDIDQYAPYIEAVFGAATGAQRIPWSVADQRLGSEQPLLDALRQLLLLPRSRFAASELLSLLEVPAVQRRIGLDDAALERIRTWVLESGIRWGSDAAMRAGLDLPAENANTWAFGLDRLFLGYAMPPDADAEPYAGVLPYIDIEGGEVAGLGLLQSFVDRLDAWRTRLMRDYPLPVWRDQLNELLAALFDPDQDEAQRLQGVRDRLDTLVSLAAATGFERPVSLDVLRSLLDSVFEQSPGAQRFLTGRVTFCNMVPMRAIPFRVTCLIGMNGDDFPRAQRPLSFDLMAQSPRRGDRSRRRDDRYLFLEALLSARDVLYLSYIGNDVRDNSVKVPSVMVSELLDYLDRAYAAGDDQADDLSTQIVLRHPLQAFSRAYFDGSDARLFSYESEWLEASRTETSGQSTAGAAFAAADLAAPDDALRTLDISALLAFVRDPSGYFLKQRLGLRLPDEDSLPEDSEPFAVDGLDRYQLQQRMLQYRLADIEPALIAAQLSGQGLLPHGAPGELLVSAELDAVDAFVTRLRGLAAPMMEPLEVDLDLGGFRLPGQLDRFGAQGRLDYRFATIKARDRLRAWVHHLVLNALAPPGAAKRSLFVARKQSLLLDPVDNAAELLLDLLECRWSGLQRPLPFFPGTSLARLDPGSDAAVANAWAGDHNPAAEAGAIAVQIAFRGRDPLDDEFRATAERILAPMLEHSQIVKAGEER